MAQFNSLPNSVQNMKIPERLFTLLHSQNLKECIKQNNFNKSKLSNTFFRNFTFNNLIGQIFYLYMKFPNELIR